MSLLDHVFALILLVGFAMWGARNSTARQIDRLARRIAADPNARTNEYLWTIGIEWGLTLALLAGWLSAARPLPALGVVLPEGTGAWWTVLVCVAGIFFYVRQARTVAASPDAQASIRKELESPKCSDDSARDRPRSTRLRWALDHRRDLRGSSLPRLPLVVLQSLGLGRGAVVVAIVAFGITHSFQGIRGIIGTGVMGAVFLGAYLLTGSLVAPIVLHATVDLANGLMAYRFFQRTETAASSSPDLRGSHDHPDVPGSEELRG